MINQHKYEEIETRIQDICKSLEKGVVYTHQFYEMHPHQTRGSLVSFHAQRYDHLLQPSKKSSSSKKPKKTAKELMVDKLFIESDDGI